MDRLWIAWEDHRRSRELAKVFQADYRPVLSSQPYALRAVLLTFRTLALLLRRRPALLFVQNPSILLATLACLLRPLFGYTLVVDRHSNFKLETLEDGGPKMGTFHALSRWTVRRADLTIVTNTGLQTLVEDWGGRASVLPDILPDFQVQVPETTSRDGRFHAVFVAGYGPDEPLDEVLAATAAVGDGMVLHVTGDYARHGVVPPADGNVRFTGFLEDGEYLELLAGCDAVMALTTGHDILNCAAYEAIALGRPLILSDTALLRDYFSGGPVFVEPEAESIAAAVRLLQTEGPRREAMIGELEKRLRREWWGRQAVILERLGLDGHVPNGAGHRA